MPRRHPSWMLLIVTSWSYDRKLFSKSELVGTSFAIGGFSHFDEDIYPRFFMRHLEMSRRRFVRFQGGQLLLVSADQMPFQNEFHGMAEGLRGIDVGRKQHPARREQIIKDVHQPLADPVRHIVEKTGAINKIIGAGRQF